jgi:AraC family transcriptional regulator
VNDMKAGEALSSDGLSNDTVETSPESLPVSLAIITADPIRFVHEKQCVAMHLHSGVIELAIGDSPMQKFECGAGDVVLCHRHVEKRVRSNDGMQSLIFEVSDIALQEVAGKHNAEVKLKCSPRLPDKRIQALMAAVNAERISGFSSGRLFLESIEMALANVLVKSYADEQVAVRLNREGLTPVHLRRVLEFIENGISSDLSLSSLAGETGYSRVHFSAMFQKATGMAPHRYVINRRIEHAKSLLKRNDLSLLEIAIKCGFSSQPHLSSIFRRHTGITPGAFRRNYQSQCRAQVVNGKV